MQKPQRILQVFGALDRGGAETMIMNIYRNIDRGKIQFDFVKHTNQKCAYDEEIKKLGGKIYCMPKYKIINHFQYKRAWKSLLKNCPEYKIIHGHIRSTASIYLKIAKQMGLITICHSHSISDGKGLKALVKKYIQKRIPQYCDYVMACSKQALIWLFGLKYNNPENSLIINNPIDTNKFKFNKQYRTSIRKKYNLDDKSILIGHIGRFVDVKNHRFIIKIAKKIVNQNNNIYFMLCGDGELKDKIQKKVQKYKLSNNILFVSSKTDIYKYYNAFDYFILPSKYEGLGMVLIEAQINGLRCLASDKIPYEAKISNKLEFLTLEENAWIDFLEKNLLKTDDRKVTLFSDLTKYSIKDQVNKISNVYLSLMEKDRR